jgi:hypothetical protein
MFGDNLTIETIKNNGPIYNNGKLKMIIYYIPFSRLYRSSLNIGYVKNNCVLRIEVRGSEVYNFLQSIENTQYEITDDKSIDVRCVVEFFYDDNNIFIFSLTGHNVIINDHIIINDMRFYRILLQYLPKKYDFDVEFINWILGTQE